MRTTSSCFSEPFAGVENSGVKKTSGELWLRAIAPNPAGQRAGLHAGGCPQNCFAKDEMRSYITHHPRCG